MNFTSWLTPGAGAAAGTTKLALYHWEHKTVRTKVRGTWKRVRVGYWRLRTTRTITADPTGRLTSTYRVPYSGEWKVAAHYAGAAGFSASVSGTKRFSAK